MKICVDIQSAVGRQTGVGRYAACLVRALADRLDAKSDLCLFFGDMLRRGSPVDIEGADLRALRWLPTRLLQQAWKTLGWPPFEAVAGAADVYHFPNFIMPPMKRGPAVVTVHDLAFVRYPETIETRNLAYLESHLPDTLRRADAVIGVSEFTCSELKDRLGVDEGKLFPVQNGLGAEWYPAPAAERERVLAGYRLQKPYLLAVSTIEPRKNYGFLIDCYEAMKDFDGDLVIVGRPGWHVESIMSRIENASGKKAIRYLNYVPADDLRALYGGASLFVFPSLYEGFGFTPLEAMVCGAPVVASNRGALPEVLGDAAVLLDHFDRDGWVHVLESLLTDEAAVATLRQKGFDRAKRYTWVRCASETMAVYERLTGGHA